MSRSRSLIAGNSVTSDCSDWRTTSSTGGSGQPLVVALAAIEEFAKVCRTAAFQIFEANTGPAQVINHVGIPEHKERWLPVIVKGERTVAVGGSEATVRIAKADLVPTTANLLAEYRTFGELEAACRAFCVEVNDRPHRETRRRPVEALAEECTRLHPLPTNAFTVAFGTTRRVNWDATISVEGVRYSVPHELVDTRVWARFHGDELIVTAVGEAGPVEVARHARSTPGTPSIRDEHYPPRQDKDGERTPKATSAAEAAFLALGPGAASWLTEAAAVGARRIRAKMAEAVALAKLHGQAEVDKALGTAAIVGRFAENDLIRILTHQTGRDPDGEPTRAGEGHSLQPGTSAWSSFGLTSPATDTDDGDALEVMDGGER